MSEAKSNSLNSGDAQEKQGTEPCNIEYKRIMLKNNTLLETDPKHVGTEFKTKAMMYNMHKDQKL